MHVYIMYASRTVIEMVGCGGLLTGLLHLHSSSHPIYTRYSRITPDSMKPKQTIHTKHLTTRRHTVTSDQYIYLTTMLLSVRLVEVRLVKKSYRKLKGYKAI